MSPVSDLLVGALVAVAVVIAAGRPSAPARPLPRGPAAAPSAGVTRRVPVRLAVLAAAVVALFVAPPVAVVVAFGAWAQPRLAARSRAQRHRRAVLQALPDAVDLLRLAVDAGLSLPLAVPAVARRIDEPLASALHRADREAASGRPRAEALTGALAPLGERARSLGAALADHLNYGSPLAPLLERQALELRLARRHDAEQEARRVPVRLLLPLVLCILPAFGLLTVVPLLAGSLSALP